MECTADAQQLLQRLYGQPPAGMEYVYELYLGFRVTCLHFNPKEEFVNGVDHPQHSTA